MRFPKRTRSVAFPMLLAAAFSVQLHAGRVVRVDLSRKLAKGSVETGLTKQQVARAIENAAKSLKRGDVFIMPNEEFDDVTMPQLPSHVFIRGGLGKRVSFQGILKNVVVENAEYSLNTSDLVFDGGATSSATLVDSSYFIHCKGLKHTLGDVTNSYFVDLIGALEVDGEWENVTGVWMRYNHEKSTSEEPSYSFKLHGSGQRVKIIHMVEHNQANHKPALYVEDADGISFLGGSTEGGSSYYVDNLDIMWNADFAGNKVTQRSIFDHTLHRENFYPPKAYPLYYFKNCTKAYIGGRRFFSGRPCNGNCSGWQGQPLISLNIDGGEGNIVDNIVDIGNPFQMSLLSTDPKIQTWSLSMENNICYFNDSTNQHIIKGFVAENTIPGIDAQFVEPRVIDEEIVMSYAGDNGATLDLTDQDAQLPAGISLPVPPALPSSMIPKIPWPEDVFSKKTDGLGKTRHLTGTSASNVAGAVEELLVTNGSLELSPGTYYLSSPIRLRNVIAKRRATGASEKISLVGSGPSATKIVYSGPGAAIELDKITVQDEEIDITIEGMTISGGEYGIAKRAATVVEDQRSWDGINFYVRTTHFKDYTRAGIYHFQGLCGQELEQGRIIDCSFEGGEYGTFYSGYSDKLLYFGCSFKNHSKAGAYFEHVVNFQSGLYQCDFEDITGYGVAILGGSGYGYGPYCYRVDNCTFTNVGSSTEPPVHLGYGWLGNFSNSTITSTRPIYAAFKGNFSAIDNVTIDIQGVSENAVYLGHQRFEKTSGLGGSRLSKVTIKNNLNIAFLPLSFMDEVSEYKCTKGQPSETPTSGYREGMYADKPWAFAYIFYKVQSGNFNTEYALVNNGAVAVDLGGHSLEAQFDPNTYGDPSSTIPHHGFGQSIRRNAITTHTTIEVFNLKGQRVLRLTPDMSNVHLPSGMHLVRIKGTTTSAKMLNITPTNITALLKLIRE